MVKQGNYGLAKGVMGNLIPRTEESIKPKLTETKSAVSVAEVTITNTDAQQSLRGKTAEQTLAQLNRDTDNAHKTVDTITVDAIQDLQTQVGAERDILQETVKNMNVVIDRRVDNMELTMMIREHPMYVIMRDDKGKLINDRETGKPVYRLLTSEEKIKLEKGGNGKINMAVNGISNDLNAAIKYGHQHLPGTGPLYVLHFPKADYVTSELLIAGYQKFFENDKNGLTKSTTELKNLMRQYGKDDLSIAAHSRASLTTGNAMESLKREPGSEGVLSGTSINFFGPAYNSEKAANLLNDLSGGSQKEIGLQNHDKDFVGRIIGGNPATWDTIPENSHTLKEWANMFSDGPTVHGCYGSGREDCTEKYKFPIEKKIGANSENKRNEHSN